MVDGETEILRGEGAMQALKAFERLYCNERDSNLELEIRLKTASSNYGEFSHMSFKDFVETLEGLWTKGGSLERYLLRQGPNNVRRKDVLDRKNNKMVSVDWTSEQKISKMAIVVAGDDRDLLSLYGYLPKLSISEETPIDPIKEYSNFASVFRLSFEFGDSWRVDASIRQRHKSSNSKAMLTSVESFLWGPELGKINSIEEAMQVFNEINSAGKHICGHDFEIEFEYLPKNGQPLPVLKDIEQVISHVIHHGICKENALNQLNAIKHTSRITALWSYMQPIWRAFDQRQAKIKDSRVKKHQVGFSGFIANPVTIGYSELYGIYHDLDHNPYMITRKLDGQRSVIIIEIERSDGITGNMLVKIFLSDSDITRSLQLSKKHYERLAKASIYPAGYNKIHFVFDSEMFKGKFYIFDVLSYASNVLVTSQLPVRVKCLEEKGFSVLTDLLNEIDIKIFVKSHKELTKDSFKKEVSKMFELEKNGFMYDGMILTHKEDLYFSRKLYKIKPPSTNSNDFLLKRIPDGRYFAYTWMNGESISTRIRPVIRKNPYLTDHFPLLSIEKYQRAPIPFATAILPNSHIVEATEEYDDTVVECILKDNKWVPIRVREDKTMEYRAGGRIYGNNYIVALKNLTTMLDFISPERVNEVDKDIAVYFRKSGRMPEYNKFLYANRLIKAIIYEKFISPQLVADDALLEVCGGRGSDILRALYAGVRSYYVTDGDLLALLEYESRMNSIVDNLEKESEHALVNPIHGKQKLVHPTVNLRTIKYMIGEDDVEEVIGDIKGDSNFPRASINVASMQYAIHYTFNDASNLSELHMFLSKLLRRNAFFACTFYDGDAILDIIRKKNGDGFKTNSNGEVIFFNGIDASKPGTPKFKIKPLFDVSKHSKSEFGRNISVWLPTISDDMYTESLVFRDILKKTFRNFKCVFDERAISMSEFVTQFIKNQGVKTTSIQMVLSDEDFAYLSLIRVVVFKKK